MTSAERRRELVGLLYDAIGGLRGSWTNGESWEDGVDKLADRIEALFVETEGAAS